jgi:spore coat protein U-like protein
MSGTGSNTDKVPYQLYSNSGLSTVWGNTATSTTVGNGVTGIGTGLAVSIPVWANAPSANFTPDSYADTVTVNVNF